MEVDMSEENRMVTYKDLENFKTDLLEEIKRITIQNQPQKWLKSKDVRKILGISGGTLQTMRNNNEIPFTRIGGLIYYREEAVHNYLISRSNESE